MSATASSLTAALATITEHWQPHRVASVNDHDVKIVKLHELFLVVEGELTIQLRDRDVVLGPNELFVIPQGVEHCPKAEHEVSAVIIELGGTVNTGDAGGDRTSPLRELS